PDHLGRPHPLQARRHLSGGCFSWQLGTRRFSQPSAGGGLLPDQYWLCLARAEDGSHRRHLTGGDRVAERQSGHGAARSWRDALLQPVRFLPHPPPIPSASPPRATGRARCHAQRFHTSIAGLLLLGGAALERCGNWIVFATALAAEVKTAEQEIPFAASYELLNMT